MIGLIKNFWRKFQERLEENRIQEDFRRYDTEQRTLHTVQAYRRFDTSQLELEVREITRDAYTLAEAAVSGDTEEVQSKISKHLAVIAKLEDQCTILKRNYRAELANAYSNKKELIENKRSAHDRLTYLRNERFEKKTELNRAFVDLDSVKSSIAAWYAKSQRSSLLLGNRGKQLPRHSLFGQSYGDLNQLKSHRDALKHSIGSCNKRIASIDREREAVKSHLGEIKDALDTVSNDILTIISARQRMHDLKRDGHRLEGVESALRSQNAQLANLRDTLQGLVDHKEQLAHDNAARMGINERQNLIGELVHKREEFITLFDSTSRLEERRNQHRRLWVAAHRRS